jgi:uncharacterized Zn finger protein
MNRREVGANWWARLWLEALERFGWGERLRRGRAYARSGEVQSIEVKPGRVEARVRGSRPRPYVVRLTLPVLDDATWTRVIAVLAGQIRYAAPLLAGEMPETIVEAFAEAGAHLFPHPDEPFVAECSCPDSANPCKHIAAMHYVLGNELDRDPFLLFRLRGRSREALTIGLRAALRAGGSNNLASGSGQDPADDQAERPLADTLDSFWSLGAGFWELRFQIEGPRVPEAILKRLGGPANGRTGELPPAELARLYRAISDRAIHSAYDDGTEST